MTRLPDISNLKINNAGAMEALAKGDEMKSFVPDELWDERMRLMSAQPIEAIDAWTKAAKMVSELKIQLATRDALIERLTEYKWIPVSERLPEDRATILAAFKNREILTATYYEHYEGFGGVENYWHIEGWHSGEVTHWMPLPEAPKEDE